MFRNKTFITTVILFVILNIFLYVFIAFFHTTVPFKKDIYAFSAHHYVHDARILDREFSFLRALGAWDAQWYLRIADAGYPTREVFEAHTDPRFMGALTYAFFPLYPLLLFIINVLFQNIEVTAFLVTNILLVANFFSLYYVVTKLFSRAIAIRTIFLLLLFPFSIFYRSYFTENIFLLLLIWLSYFLIKHKFFYSAIMASLIFICRPNGLVVGLVFFVALYEGVWKKRLSWNEALLYFITSFIPFGGWLMFCYVQTGNPLYWQYVQTVWYKGESVFSAINYNLEQVLTLFNQPFHEAHNSQIDCAMIVLVGVLLLLSRKFFKKYPHLWWLSVIIWFFPLLVKDTMSFSRYQVISFPLFIFLAAKVTGWKFYALSGVFLVILFITSVYFVNWRWVG